VTIPSLLILQELDFEIILEVDRLAISSFDEIPLNRIKWEIILLESSV